MWTNVDKKFSTPPPTWRRQRPPPSPMSEKKRMSPGQARNDLFHVIHKVPATDSPYGRAKHAQLIDKDPSRAVAMFWAAINAGDRVDSALKDMAVVMKQLNRSDEAIEAIKSFRHLCPYESQESLDNVLIELYKRSGRMEEEIEMLQQKLKSIEDGIAFGGAKTKMARSRGKKIHITIEQERSRILGNLAWTYLQQNNYEIAEQHYRQALSLEADKNMLCNLAICLMHMNRMKEAKSLLQALKASTGDKRMDDSYAKSFERALQILTKLESSSVSEPIEHDGHDEETVLFSEQDRTEYCRNYFENKNSFFGYDKGGWKCVSFGPTESSQFSPYTMFANNWREGSYLGTRCGRSGSGSTTKEHWAGSPGTGVSFASQETYATPASVRRRDLDVPFTQPRRRPSWGFGNREQRIERRGDDHHSSEQTLLTENAVLFTQPRKPSSYESIIGGDQKRGKWGEKAVSISVRKLSFEQAITYEKGQEDAQNVLGEAFVSTNGPHSSETALPSPTGEDKTRKMSWREIAQVKNEAAVKHCSQTMVNGDRKSICWGNDGFAQTKDGSMIEPGTDDIVDGNWISGGLETSLGNKTSEKLESFHPQTAEGLKSSQDCSTAAKGKKSWADMVEEDEKGKHKTLSETNSEDGSDGWNMDEEENFIDENQNSNIIYASPCPQNHQIDYLSQKLEGSFSLKDGYGKSKNAAVLSKNQTARRSLCFEQHQQRESTDYLLSPALPNKGLNRKNNNSKTRARLQVFQDITTLSPEYGLSEDDNGAEIKK